MRFQDDLAELGGRGWLRARKNHAKRKPGQRKFLCSRCRVPVVTIQRDRYYWCPDCRKYVRPGKVLVRKVRTISKLPPLPPPPSPKKRSSAPSRKRTVTPRQERKKGTTKPRREPKSWWNPEFFYLGPRHDRCLTSLMNQLLKQGKLEHHYHRHR